MLFGDSCDAASGPLLAQSPRSLGVYDVSYHAYWISRAGDAANKALCLAYPMHRTRKQLCISLVLSTGNVKHAAGWQKVLEQIITQLVPPMAVYKLPSASTLSSPDHASSVDMVISPPPVPLASHHSPHPRNSPARMQQKQSPARSSGSAGRSPAGSSPRLLPLSGRVQKRTSSALRPR